MRGASARTVRAAGAGLALASLGAVLGAAASRGRLRAQIRSSASDLERANVEAVRHARLLQAILDSTQDGIAVIDGQGEPLLHNPAALAILGPRDKRDAGRRQVDHGFFHLDGQTPFAPQEQPLTRALNGQASDQVLMLVRNDDHPAGSVISVCAVPLTAPDGRRGAVAVFHDVSALRQHEADLVSFAGIVAHDLKSPLSSILGFTEMARDEAAETSPDTVVLLDRVLATSRRMAQLIDDLLSYASARDGDLEAEDLDLQAAVDAVIDERFAAADLIVAAPAPEVQVGPLPAVHADPAMVYQLLDNLIGNALKYTPPGRPARLDVTAGPDTPGWTRIEIADHGIGIPPGQHLAVFEDFHRAQPNGQYAGTGLGLAICQRIVSRHGGRIGVQDNPGGGARFWFTLPSAQVRATPGHRARDTASARAGTR